MIADAIIKAKDESEPKKISHELLRELIDLNEDMLEEMKTMNKNLAIVGVALLKMAEGKKKVNKP